MSLNILITSECPKLVDGDAFGVIVSQKSRLQTGLSSGVVSNIKVVMKKRDFSGEWGVNEMLVVTNKGLKVPLVGLLGVGDLRAEMSRVKEGMRRAVGGMIQECRRHGAWTVVIDLSGSGIADELAIELAGTAIEAVQMANYRYVEYSERVKKDQVNRAVRKLSIVVDRNLVKNIKKEMKQKVNIGQGVNLARDLVNMPALDMTPGYLVKQAKKIAKESANISCKVFNAKEAEKMGMAAFLAVARGSSEEPYVIHLTYKPAVKKKKVKKVVLVGKGITFDSGGLSLKPAQHMEDMKIDMGGAATVLGLFSTLHKLSPGVEVHGVIAACENMPSGEAYRPGDVVAAKNGKTIEVLNTDAEGRVTLADALSYAVELKPDAIIDMATLTGACVVALGETVAGMWQTNDELREQLLAAAKGAGEGLDDMPMPDEYRPLLNSQVADLRNISTSNYGGAITAAMFLREFTGKVPWAHIDIAGPAYAGNVVLPYHVKGATGYGVRTLVEYLGSL